MDFGYIIFYLLIALAGLSALGILLLKNVFKAALLLLVCLLSIAGLYVFSFAEFIAVAQILIYAGGIVVLIIFAVMLTTRFSGTSLLAGYSNIALGVIVVLAMVTVLGTTLPNLTIQGEKAEASPSGIEDVGLNLMTRYALPFEFSGVILLLALIAAAVISGTKASDNDHNH